MARAKGYARPRRSTRKAARVQETRAFVSAPQTRYLESSAIAAALLEYEAAAVRSVRMPGRRVMSALALAEARRAVVQARGSGRLSVELERAAFAELQILVADCTLIDVSSAVLERAGRLFPVEPARTLDAIHLATVELLGEAPQLVTVVTRDRRIRDNAIALGFAVE